MKIYNYDDQGIFQGEGQSTIDPENKKRTVIPANTTTKKPPTGPDGKVAVFTIAEPLDYTENEGIDGSWSLKDDHRGKTVYDTITGQPSIIDYLGEIKATHTTKPKPSPWHKWAGDDWLEKKISELSTQEKSQKLEQELDKTDAETDAEIIKGFTYDGHSFSLSREAQINWSHLSGKLDTNNLTDNFPVSTMDDGEYVLTLDKAKAFFNKAFTTVVTELRKGREKKMQLKKDYQ